MEEALQTFVALRRWKLSDEEGFRPGAPDTITNLNRHAMNYGYHEDSAKFAIDRFNGLEKFFPVRESRSFGEVVRSESNDIYMKDITTDDVRLLGLCVVRVLIPNAQPLDVNNVFQHQFRDGVSLKLPVETRPHPFP